MLNEQLNKYKDENAQLQEQTKQITQVVDQLSHQVESTTLQLTNMQSVTTRAQTAEDKEFQKKFDLPDTEFVLTCKRILVSY
jgi:hypothetical protein